MCAPASAQISPGKLAEPHEFLEGVKNCLKCHELGSGPSAKKCLECHKEIAVRIDQKQGYHFRAVTRENKACFDCHGDHAGREFQLVHWPDGINGFRHVETGYPLDGRHGSVKCRDCHKPEFMVDDMGKYQETVDLKRTFLGLGRECLICHSDEHREQLAAECETCHNFEGWKPAPKFDHDRANFVLVGRHRQVDCAKCHPTISESSKADPKDRSFVRYKKIASASCVDCHADEHRGQLASDCTTCHNQEGWKPAPRFDHSRTRYVLTGKHLQVECAKCHPTVQEPAPEDPKDLAFVKYAGVVSTTCAACHKDVHAGKLGGDCKSCHQTSGWLTITSANFDHSRTRFPLKGLHARAGCDKCHGTQTKTQELKFERCEDCHNDVHQGQFARRKDKGRCESCHNEDGFLPARFTMADHDAEYSLTGAHLAQPCVACHKQQSGEDGAKYYQYVIDDTRCTSCHADTHAGQFDRRPKRQCEDCHKTTFWTDLAFDHDRDSSYQLVGAHRAVRCSGCHKQIERGGKKFVHYRPIDHACQSCHKIEGLKLE